jgi:hypothetical protein
VGTFAIPNTTGTTIYVKKTAIWHGVDFNQIAGVNSEMYRRSDFALVMTFPEQRFAQPNGTTQLVTDFTPDYFMLVAGDVLDVYYACIPISGSGFHAQISATVWYTTVP